MHYTQSKSIQKHYRSIIWPLVLFVSYAGFWIPKSGLILFPMLLIIMVSGFYKNRYWCGNLCPRGSFLDRLRSVPLFPKRALPKLFKAESFKIGILIVLMSFFLRNTLMALGTMNESGALDRLGMAGVMMCALTTTIALGLALFYQPRAWCSVCPMGTVQTKLFKFSQNAGADSKNSKILPESA